MFRGSPRPAGNILRFGAEENPPTGLSWLLATQTVALIIAGIILTPAIILRGAGMPEGLEAGVIFFALMVCGLTTVVQAVKVWHVGAGYILLMGTSGAFIAVAITALQRGGMGLLMTLIVVSSLIQFLLAHKLVLLRRVITPLVGGTTIMLLAVTVMPIAFKQFPISAGDNQAFEAPLVAGVALLTILGFSFFGSGQVRLWAPIIGIIAGSALSALFGDLDTSRIADAAWVGLPDLAWPGFDLSFSQDFWIMLPAFVIVTVVGAIETFGDSIAIQRISHREERPVDFRVVQGALNADGLGNFLSGCLGTMPNTTYSTSISIVDLTGVASRQVGLFCGVILLVLAFFPKISAVILSIPPSVVGAYLIVLILLLFMHGIRMVARDGLTYEKGFIVGMGFWLGTGFQQGVIFPHVIPDWLAPILGNGMTSGTLVTVCLVAILGLRRGRKVATETHLTEDAIAELKTLTQRFAERNLPRHRQVEKKLLRVAEETVEALIEMRSESPEPVPDKLHFELQKQLDHVELSVGIAPLEHDLRDMIDASQHHKPMSISDAPFKTLGKLVEELQHYRYFGLDLITLVIRFDQPDS